MMRKKKPVRVLHRPNYIINISNRIYFQIFLVYGWLILFLLGPRLGEADVNLQTDTL